MRWLPEMRVAKFHDGARRCSGMIATVSSAVRVGDERTSVKGVVPNPFVANASRVGNVAGPQDRRTPEAECRPVTRSRFRRGGRRCFDLEARWRLGIASTSSVIVRSTSGRESADRAPAPFVDWSQAEAAIDRQSQGAGPAWRLCCGCSFHRMSLLPFRLNSARQRLASSAVNPG